MGTARDILLRITPVQDRVVLRPLTPSEIEDLERRVGVPMPRDLLEYLEQVGLFNDLPCPPTSDYEPYRQQEEFESGRAVLQNSLGSRAEGLFPFADDGAGDVIAVRSEPDGDRIYFFNHETGSASPRELFCEWLESVVDDVLQDAPARAENTRKRWYVQFGFETNDPDRIFAALEMFAPVEIPSRDWRETGVSPAKVSSAELPFRLGEENLLLKRLTYPAWAAPKFFIDYSEPVNLPPGSSRILKLDEIFARQNLGYKRIDYGPQEEREPDPRTERSGRAESRWRRILKRLFV